METWKLGNALAFAAMVGVNAAANIIPIGGNTTGEVSANYPNLFTPAPITFAIWGIIYLMLAGFIVYQWGPFDTEEENKGLRSRLGAWFIISCVMNIAWIFAWHFDAIALSLVFILGLLVSLIFIERCIKSVKETRWSRILVNATFDIYFGWIFVATIANAGTLLTKLGWDFWGLGQPFGVIFALLIATGILSILVVAQRKPILGLTAIWAFAGILIRHLSPAELNSRYPFVIMAIVFSMVFLMSMIVYSIACTSYWRKHTPVAIR